MENTKIDVGGIIKFIAIKLAEGLAGVAVSEIEKLLHPHKHEIADLAIKCDPGYHLEDGKCVKDKDPLPVDPTHP